MPGGRRPTIRPRRSAAAAIYLLLAVGAGGLAVAFIVYGLRPWTPEQIPTPGDVAAENRPTVILVALGACAFLVAAAIFDGRQRQRWVVGLEPNRAVSTVVYAILGLAASAILLMALVPELVPAGWQRLTTEVGARGLAWAALISAALAVVLLGAATVNGRRWWIAHRIARLSGAGGSTAGARNHGRLAIATRRPIRPRGLRFRRVGDRNVVGSAPINIAYLRLFENQPRTRTFVQGAWREFGYVHMLRSAGSVSGAEYRELRRSRRRFIDSVPELEGELLRAPRRPTTPGLHRLDRIGNKKIVVWDRYGGYPTRPVLCHGSFWQVAVDHLLDRMDLVVLDLSGFLEGNRGTLYELQRVIDRFPLDRVVFLRDPRGSRRFVEEHIQRAWGRMDDRSPNAGTAHPTTLLLSTDYFMQINADSTAGPGQWRLKARRSQTRRIMAALNPQPRMPAPAIGHPMTAPLPIGWGR